MPVEPVAFCLNRDYMSSSWDVGLLVSRVASASHHIGAMLAPGAVERVCWHRDVKLHRPFGRGHQNLLTACAKMVNVLSAPEQDSFQPIRSRRQFTRAFLPLSEPAEVTLETDGTNARSRLQRALS